MTYKELKTKYPDRMFGRVRVTRNFDVPHERFDVPFDNCPVTDLGWVMELEHQCDEWEIGGVEEGMDLVAELNLAIDFCHLNE